MKSEAQPNKRNMGKEMQKLQQEDDHCEKGWKKSKTDVDRGGRGGTGPRKYGRGGRLCDGSGAPEGESSETLWRRNCGG